MAEKRYTCNCGGRTVKCYHPCNAGCCPNGKDIGSSRGGVTPTGLNPNPTNPAMAKGFGFDTSFDGRIRGGIKTPDFINAPKVNREFNIMDSRSSQSKPMMANRSNSNAPNTQQATMREGTIVRIHPLDIAGARRVIGREVFDPISQKWKIDDGRPRGIIYSGGKSVWGCWGKCTVKRWHGIGNRVKCPCNKGTSQDAGCECAGCMSGGAC
tara:strand:+ start:337 stop:969 length:633 start_codon:yes stop_codon:yes gene_type:complete